jgi:hypothetical protein
MNQINKYILPFFLILFISTTSFVNSTGCSSDNLRIDSNNNEIIWNNDYKLKWSDFKGIPDKNSSYNAVTSSRLQVKDIQYSNEIVEYELMAVFQKNKSWTKSDGIDLLAHEQLHFDIAELVMRKARKKFLEHKFENLEGVNNMINLIIKQAGQEGFELGEQYDNETEHGIHKENQKKWQKKIENELDALKQYSPSKVTLKK